MAEWEVFVVPFRLTDVDDHVANPLLAPWTNLRARFVATATTRAAMHCQLQVLTIGPSIYYVRTSFGILDPALPVLLVCEIGQFLNIPSLRT